MPARRLGTAGGGVMALEPTGGHVFSSVTGARLVVGLVESHGVVRGSVFPISSCLSDVAVASCKVVEENSTSLIGDHGGGTGDLLVDCFEYRGGAVMTTSSSSSRAV